jgi:hypothetical protein
MTNNKGEINEYNEARDINDRINAQMHYPTTSMQYTSRKMKYIQHEPE